MGKLTKRSIEALAPREIDYIAWDNDVPGFGVRVMPSGRKSFVLQYRAGRRSRRMVLGYVNVIAPERARGMAIQHLAALRQGVDPLTERDGGRDAVTVKDLAARFDAEHIAVHLKASTQKEYRRSLKKLILPAFGKRPIAEVSREEVARFHHKYRHVPYQANRCLEILSKMFNLAELGGLRPDGSNPRKHIKKYREEKRERFLSAAELRRVGEVLREMEVEGLEMPSAIAAVMLLILTGCRLNEIMTLRWEYVDFAAGVLNLPDSKTGAKTIHLGKPAIDTLRRLPHLVGNPWVICGIKPGGRLIDLQPFWQRLRARAGLKDARIHDLRHTFASAAVAAGQCLPMIGKLLGHTQVATTARYAHLAADPVKAAADHVSTAIARSILARDMTRLPSTSDARSFDQRQEHA
jgi:integrase